MVFCSTNSKISSFHEDTRSNSTRWAVSCLSDADEVTSSPEDDIVNEEKRPKTAFQRLNHRFEKVLAELKQVHLRTMKPAGLPPMNGDISTTPVIDIGLNSRCFNQLFITVIMSFCRPKSVWKHPYKSQEDDKDLPDIILL